LELLFAYRDELTPDFIHFLMSVVEDEAHYICIMSYWLFWKCFLLEDHNKVLQKIDERRKICARAALELIVGLILSTAIGTNKGLWPYVYCTGVFIFAAIRSIFYESCDLTFKIFIVVYFS
jgi:hypothetical protein